MEPWSELREKAIPEYFWGVKDSWRHYNMLRIHPRRPSTETQKLLRNISTRPQTFDLF